MFGKLFAGFGKKAEVPVEVDEESLKRLAALISESDKVRIIGLASEGRKIEAVQACREATGAGLKDAKDIVDDYQKYLGE
jgi:ribosomal protein L7/L12